MIKDAHQKLDKDSDYDILFDEDFVTLENFIIFMYTLVCRGIREKYYQTESWYNANIIVAWEIQIKWRRCCGTIVLDYSLLLLLLE